VLDPDLPRPGGRRAKLATPLARLRSNMARRNPRLPFVSIRSTPYAGPAPASLDGSRRSMPGTYASWHARNLLACSLPLSRCLQTSLDPTPATPIHLSGHVTSAAAGRGVGTVRSFGQRRVLTKGRRGFRRAMFERSRASGVASLARRPPGRGRPGQSGRAAPRPLDGPDGTHPSPCGVLID